MQVFRTIIQYPTIDGKWLGRSYSWSLLENATGSHNLWGHHSIIIPRVKTGPPTFLNISECLNPNGTLNTPHLNYLSIKDTIQEVLSHLQETTPYFTNYIDSNHIDSFFFVWNIIISIGLIYLFFHRGNIFMATAVPQTVAADTGSPKYATIQFGTLVVALMVFLLYMGFKLYQQWSEYRSSAHVQK